jgi:autotransporter-associated beta strand protein
VQNIYVGATGESANTYTYSGGTITLGGASPNVIAITNATDSAIINSSISGTNLFFNNNLGSSSGSTITGQGNLTLSGNNSGLSGQINVGGYSAGSGYLRIITASALGNTTIRTGGQACTTQFQIDGTAGSVIIPSTNTFTLNGRAVGGVHGTNLTGAIVNFAGNNTINSTISTDSGGSDYLIESDAGLLTINNTFTCNNAGNRYLYLQGNGNGEFTTAGIISGSATLQLIKAGSGTWILDGNNSYTGGTLVNGGALRLKNSNALGTTTTALNTVTGGTAASRIELDGSTSALSIGNVITLQGRSVATAAHLENVAGNNAISGDISLAVGGDQYIIQSDADTLTLNTITNNTASATPRYLTLQGSGSGQVGGIIGNGTGTTGAVNVIKNGTGTWTLSAANTYTGAATISGGTLSLGTTGSISSSSTAINVNSGAFFDVSGLSTAFTVGSGATAQTLAGSGTVLGSVANGIINGSNGVISPGGDAAAGTLNIQSKLALGSSLTSTVKFDLASNNTPANNDLLSVAGDLSIPGTSTFAFNMLNNQLASATYKLISYTGSLLTGGASSIIPTGLGSGTTRQSFALSSAIAHEIDLVVTGSPASLIWKGGLNGNTWDNTTLNWNNNTDKFFNLDLVTFNDTPTSPNTNINISTTVQPGSMIFNNTTAKDYKFTGTGAIGGAGGMTLSGGGKVILANTGNNNYSGITQIDTGTLQIGDGGANGSIGAGSVVDNTALVFNQSGNYGTDPNTILSGAGTLQKQGTGTLTLNGNSPSFSGPVTISGGTVVMGGANALGTTNTTSITIANNAALDVNGNSVGARPVSVQGAGPDGTSGAIVSSASADQQNAFRYVTLAGPTTFGGTGRWDIRSSGGGSLTGGGYALSKVGTNLISLVNLGDTGLGDIHVKNGILQIEGSTTPGSSGTITVESGAMLSMYAITTTLTKNLTLNGGTLGTSFGTAGTTNNFGGTVTLVSGGILSPTVDTSGTSGFTVSGSIGGTGLLTKSGTAGTVILTGLANSWNGGTTINGGTLQIGNGGANGSLPDVVGTFITNNGTLVINSTNNTNLLNTTITTTTPAGAGIGNLTVNGTGLVTLGQANSYTGTTQVGASDGAIGFLRIQNSTALGTGTTSIAGGSNTGRLELDGGSAAGGGITISSPISLDGRRDTQNLALAPHILNVSGNNVITADIACQVWGNQYLFQSDAGKLTLRNVINNTGNAAARYVYLRGAGDGEIAGTLQNGTGTGSQNVIKDGLGTWTLSEYNLYTGNTTIKQGTLALGVSANIGSSPVIQVMSGAKFDVHNVSSYILYGTQTLSGSGTVVGDVVDNGGTIISPGDTSGAGTLTFNNSSNTLTLAGSDFINYNISGATADLLDVKGNLTLSGTTGAETTISVLPNKVTTGAAYTVASIAGTLTGGAANVKVDSSTTRYIFTPSVTTVGSIKNLILTAGGTNKSLTWNGLASTWDINSTVAWNTSDAFFNADDVTFGDTAGVTGVGITSAVMPASLTVNSANDYTFSGTGKITGDVGLVKQGTGTLTLSLANDYTGQTNVQAGTLFIDATGNIGPSPVLVSGGMLRVGSGTALGDATIGTTITSGTLDTNSQNLGAEPITVQGAGLGGNGAIVNNSGTAQNNTLRFVTLSNDTTFGGTTRWDIRTDTPATTPAALIGNGYKLTKVGANAIYLVNVGNTGLGNIAVDAGALGLQGNTTLGDSSKTLTLASSTTLNFYAIGATNIISKSFDFKGGSFIANGGGNALSMAGNTTLEGNVTFTTDNNITLTGNITGTGGSSGLTKSGTAILTLAGTQNYSGATTISAGAVDLSGTGTIGNVANSTTFELLDGNHTVGNITGTGTTILDANAVLTATSVVQNTVTLGIGSRITIAPIPGGPTAGAGSLTAVPEPSTWAMLMLAVMGLGMYWRRSR